MVFRFLTRRFLHVCVLRANNVISNEYKHIPLRRRKFEVIRVLGHHFRGHQSWEDRDLGEIGDFVKDSYVKDM